MIYTVTFNPALDYVVRVDDFKEGMTNRSHDEVLLYGGKGVNVSYILKQLGFDSVALGFVAGFTGKEFVSGIEKMGIQSEMIFLKEGLTRINVKLKSREESEINASGPVIDKDSLKQLYTKLDALKDNDVLVLSGSIPHSLPSTIYEDIMSYLQNKKILYVVDAANDLLVNVLKYHPFLIKPNHQELSEIFNVEIKTDDDIIYYAKEMQKMGARNVLVSMAKDGSILVDENQNVIKMGVCKGKVINSVGAGDSMLAGFVGGYLKGYDMLSTLALATACGGATAFSEGLANKDKIEELFIKAKELVRA